LRESSILVSSKEAIIDSYRSNFLSTFSIKKNKSKGFSDSEADENAVNTRNAQIAERRLQDLQSAPSSKSPRLLIKEVEEEEEEEEESEGSTVEKLFSCLQGEPHVRIAAARTLRDASCPTGPEHFGILRAQLHKDPYKILAIQHAIDILRGEDESTMESALGIIQFLASRGDHRVNQALLHMLLSSTCRTELRASAARTLSSLVEHNDEVVISSVSSLLQTRSDAHVPVKVEAVHLIADICTRGHPAAVKVFHAALRDRSSAVRQTALSLISSIVEPGDSRTIAMVSALIKDSDPRNRVCAVQALKQIARQGDQIAVDIILYALKDTNVQVRYAAVDAIKKIMKKEELQVIFRTGGLLANIDKHRLEDVSRQLVLNWKGGKVNECFASWLEHHKQQRRIKDSVKRTLKNAKIQIGKHQSQPPISPPESPSAMEIKSSFSHESEAPHKRGLVSRSSLPSRTSSRRTRDSFRLKLHSSDLIGNSMQDLEDRRAKTARSGSRRFLAVDALRPATSRIPYRRSEMSGNSAPQRDITQALLDPCTKMQERVRILRSFSGLRKETDLLHNIDPQLVAAVMANVDSTLPVDGVGQQGEVCVEALQALKILSGGGSIVTSAMQECVVNSTRSYFPEVRRVALELLPSFFATDGTQVVDLLVRLSATDPDWLVRSNACKALALLSPKHDKAAFNALLQRAQEKDWAVRNAAYKAMSSLGDAHRDWTAIKEIQRIMSRYNASSLHAAKQALFDLSVGHKLAEDKQPRKPSCSEKPSRAQDSRQGAAS